MSTVHKFIRVFTKQSKSTGKLNHYASILIIGDSKVDTMDVYITEQQYDKLKEYEGDNRFDIAKFISVDWDFYYHKYKTVLTV